MNNERMPRGEGLLARAALLVVLGMSAGACTAATAAGCGTGVLATMAITAIAIGAQGDSDGGKVDAGAAFAGAALLGTAAGCSAGAVADGMARSDEHKKRKRDERASTTTNRHVSALNVW